MAKLGEVCLLKAGKFVSANDISPEYNKGLYPCFGGNGIRGYVADYTHDGEFPLIGRQGALCGNVNLASGKFHATEHAVVVQPKIEMNVHWLYYALNAMNLGQYATGAAQPGLAVSKLETLSIEIPNISEQNKIAQTLYKVEQLVNFRKQQLAKLDELVKARFVEMFGEPINNPMKWIVSKIEDIAAQEKNALKAGPFGSALKKEFYVKSGYKIYGQEQVICGDASFGDYYIDEEKYKELKNCAVQAGDILISLVGTYGKALIMPDNYEAGIINPRLMKITLNKNKVKPIYFKYYFESDALKASMDANTHGGTMGILNLGIIRQMKIQVPPLSLQNQFAAFVERVDKQKQTVQQSLEKLELMKKALMQEYFG